LADSIADFGYVLRGQWQLFGPDHRHIKIKCLVADSKMDLRCKLRPRHNLNHVLVGDLLFSDLGYAPRKRLRPRPDGPNSLIFSLLIEGRNRTADPGGPGYTQAKLCTLFYDLIWSVAGYGALGRSALAPLDRCGLSGRRMERREVRSTPRAGA